MSAGDPQTTGPAGPELDDPRVIRALEEYLEAIESGERPNRHAFLARHGDIADALARCLDGMEALHVAVSPSSAPRILSPSAGGQAEAPPAGTWGPGSMVGDFRIVREVGRGGMGIVYEAEQVSLGRRIALKVLPFAFTLDARQLQRFKNEARAAAQLHHSNIVPIYSVGCERGVHFYAMQYIEGQTLAEVIADLRRLETGARAVLDPAVTRVRHRSGAGEATQAGAPAVPAADTAGGPAGALATSFSAGGPGFFRAVAKLGVQAAEALEHAHSFGIIHRDVKPANFLVDAAGHLWVTDFGLAQLQGDAALTRTGDLLGTLRYMSPEQALARRGVVDHRTDIYSLGVTLYELLTREPPYAGRDREELLRQLALDEPRPPRRWEPRIPADLETIVLKAMAKTVEERYATAQELAEDLRRFLEQKPILARRPTLLERTAKWARRHKGVVVTGVGVLLLLAVGFGVSTALIGREQWRTRQAFDQLAEEQAKTQAALEGERQRAREASQQRARAEKSFHQARAAVEFLVQVVNEELPQNPMLGKLRRRLLEAALVYYQGFVSERRNDPSSQAEAELAAANERVTAILGELSAGEEFGRVLYLANLLREPDVQKDLGLSREEADKARELVEGRRGRKPPSFDAYRQLSPDERRRELEEMTRAAERDLKKLLTADQVKRLRQIALQQRGPQALEDAEVAKALALTAAQKQKVRAILAEAAPWKPGPQPPERKGPYDWGRARKTTEEKLLGVLTLAQTEHWKEMVGERFRGKVCPGFGGRFGPRFEPPPDHPNGDPRPRPELRGRGKPGDRYYHKR